MIIFLKKFLEFFFSDKQAGNYIDRERDTERERDREREREREREKDKREIDR